MPEPLATEPMEVTEQWELVLGTPPRQIVTVYGLYVRSNGERVKLPPAAQHGELLDVFAIGTRTPLRMASTVAGQREVYLPSGTNALVRVGAHIENVLLDVRNARLRWPQADTAHVPTRRMVDLPRALLSMGSDDWVCPDDGTEITTCVSHAVTPRPLTVRFALGRPATGLAVIALLLALLATLTAFQFRKQLALSRRRVLTGSLLGLLLGWSVGLVLVATLRVRWPYAASLASVMGPMAGALAMCSTSSRRVAGALVAVLAIVCVAHGGFAWVLATSLTSWLAIVLTGWFTRDPSPE